MLSGVAMTRRGYLSYWWWLNDCDSFPQFLLFAIPVLTTTFLTRLLPALPVEEGRFGGYRYLWYDWYPDQIILVPVKKAKLIKEYKKVYNATYGLQK